MAPGERDNCLLAQRSQCGQQPLASLCRFDHLINKAARCGHIRVEVAFPVLLGVTGPGLGRVICLGDLFAVEDAGGPLSPHHGDFGAGPGEGYVCAQLFAAHDYIGAAVGLAGDNTDFGHGRGGIGVDNFGPMPNDAMVLLIDAG